VTYSLLATEPWPLTHESNLQVAVESQPLPPSKHFNTREDMVDILHHLCTDGDIFTLQALILFLNRFCFFSLFFPLFSAFLV
jgi:hypothetical protein